MLSTHLSAEVGHNDNAGGHFVDNFGHGDCSYSVHYADNFDHDYFVHCDYDYGYSVHYADDLSHHGCKLHYSSFGRLRKYVES